MMPKAISGSQRFGGKNFLMVALLTLYTFHVFSESGSNFEYIQTHLGTRLRAWTRSHGRGPAAIFSNRQSVSGSLTSAEVFGVQSFPETPADMDRSRGLSEHAQITQRKPTEESRFQFVPSSGRCAAPNGPSFSNLRKNVGHRTSSVRHHSGKAISFKRARSATFRVHGKMEIVQSHQALY
jgi:hypothetical protein